MAFLDGKAMPTVALLYAPTVKCSSLFGQIGKWWATIRLPALSCEMK
jgi:hypothetical protein